ncbi:E3 ubiquitin-protein ligase CBL-C isoform X2 [Festucalex cinctus]
MATTSSEEKACQRPTNKEHRLVNKTLRRLEKLHESCTDPRLGLRNSPPYLPELVPDTASALRRVWEPYRGLGALTGRAPGEDEAAYLRVHARNLLDKTDRALLLFKEGKEKMFEETSSYRLDLTKLSLLFSHMLWELKAVFPGDRYHGDAYKLTKTEARDFWRISFGNKCIVRWSSFAEKLRRVHPFQDGMETVALKSTVDLTCNDHVSVFEFDIFTRLFQPWRSLLRNWNQLAVTHPGYMAFITYDQAVSRLERNRHKPGRWSARLLHLPSELHQDGPVGHRSRDRRGRHRADHPREYAALPGAPSGPQPRLLFVPRRAGREPRRQRPEPTGTQSKSQGHARAVRALLPSGNVLPAVQDLHGEGQGHSHRAVWTPRVQTLPRQLAEIVRPHVSLLPL